MTGNKEGPPVRLNRNIVIGKPGGSAPFADREAIAVAALVRNNQLHAFRMRRFELSLSRLPLEILAVNQFRKLSAGGVGYVLVAVALLYREAGLRRKTWRI